jgi:hypothetical protein
LASKNFLLGRKKDGLEMLEGNIAKWIEVSLFAHEPWVRFYPSQRLISQYYFCSEFPVTIDRLFMMSIESN